MEAKYIRLDPGGVSLDLTGYGIVPVTGPDLISNGSMEQLDEEGKLLTWEQGKYLWLDEAVDDPDRRAKIGKRVFELMQWGVRKNVAFDGRNSAYLAIPHAAYNPEDTPKHEFCAYYHQRVVLPEISGPTIYVLTYRCRGWCGRGMPNCRAYTRITFYDHHDQGQATKTRKYDQVFFQPGDKWQCGQLATIAPQNTRCLDIWIALAGVGEVEFDDVGLHQAKEQDLELSARLMPWALLDNQYCLSSGDTLTMFFGFRNGDDREIGQPWLVVQLPEAIIVAEAVTTRSAPRAEQKPAENGMIEYRFDLKPIKDAIQGSISESPWGQWDGLCLFVRTSCPAGTRLPPGMYWIEDGDYRSAPRSFRLKVLLPLPTIKPPKLFRAGAHLFHFWLARNPDAVQGFSRTCAHAGLNCVHVPPSAIGDELGRLGIERFWQPFSNGYQMGGGKGDKPENAVFRDIDGKPVWEAICPTEVYRHGLYFQESIVDNLLRELLIRQRRSDQLMCNWEPSIYEGKGCYCDRCKEEFKEFMARNGLSNDVVDTTWPKTVAQEYGEILQKFRSWQHGQFIGTIEETMSALGKEAGREMHFIPELQYVLLTEAWNWGWGTSEFAPLDYLDRLAAINAWAPYNWYVFGGVPYEYVRGLHLNCYTTAVEVQKFLRSNLPSDRQLRLYAFPVGTHEGVTEPEAIAFELLTYFMMGYEGAMVYTFPGGYDARHWRAIAEANRQIASIELAVKRGKRIKKHKVIPVTPLPSPDVRLFYSGSMLGSNPDRWKDLVLLQSWEFAFGGDFEQRLIVVGNFWERGDCFFRLKAGVMPGRYVLSEPLTGRYFALAANGIVSQAELAKGVLLHVGALRYAFFHLKPHSAFPIKPCSTSFRYGQLITPGHMETAMRERLLAIRKAAAQ